MNIGDPIYEIKGNKLLIGKITNVINETACDAKIDVIIPKDAFVDAYNEWIKGVNE